LPYTTLARATKETNALLKVSGLDPDANPNRGPVQARLLAQDEPFMTHPTTPARAGVEGDVLFQRVSQDNSQPRAAGWQRRNMRPYRSKSRFVDPSKVFRPLDLATSAPRSCGRPRPWSIGPARSSSAGDAETASWERAASKSCDACCSGSSTARRAPAFRATRPLPKP
jgi:hypothetical protein